MNLCKPCRDRGFEREGTRIVMGESWCDNCYFDTDNPTSAVHIMIRPMKTERLIVRDYMVGNRFGVRFDMDTVRKAIYAYSVGVPKDLIIQAVGCSKGHFERWVRDEGSGIGKRPRCDAGIARPRAANSTGDNQ
jgi:hypothetical protein